MRPGAWHQLLAAAPECACESRSARSRHCQRVAERRCWTPGACRSKKKQEREPVTNWPNLVKLLPLDSYCGYCQSSADSRQPPAVAPHSQHWLLWSHVIAVVMGNCYSFNMLLLTHIHGITISAVRLSIVLRANSARLAARPSQSSPPIEVILKFV